MKKLMTNDINNIKRLHSIYSENMPTFIEDFINTKEMQRLASVGQNCGRDYISSKLQTFQYNYSRLTHSIGVGLIVWNFTKTPKQAIAGLLHDIATPTFSHVIDYYNNDSNTQTSTEENTENIIRKSKEINEKLIKYNVDVNDVLDYSVYPIADNNMPQLSADRLEYNLYMGTARGIVTFEEAEQIYDDLIIVKNEKNIDEMCFQNLKLAKKMTRVALENGTYMSGGISSITNQLLSDILKMAVMEKILQPKMFMEKTEEDIVNILENTENTEINREKKIYRSFSKSR